MLQASEMKAKFSSRIAAGLQRVFESEISQGSGYTPIAQEQWEKLADAISDIAFDIVNEIQQSAQVVPGIQVNDNVTTSFGKIV